MGNKHYEKIYSLEELRSRVNAPKKTLIVFDVDYTLTHPNEPTFQFSNFKKCVARTALKNLAQRR